MIRKSLVFSGLLAAINFSYYSVLQVSNSAQSFWAVLMILVIPLVLYFAYRDLMIHQWDYRLPFGKAILSGLIIVIAGAVILASLHFINEQYFHLFGKEGSRTWLKAVWDFVSWYFLFALLGIPLAYLALWLKIRLKSK